MVNMFYSFISVAERYQSTKKEMKWYHKINPIIRIKLIRIKNNLIKILDAIKMMEISKRFLSDFQLMYISRLETNTYPHIELPTQFDINHVKPIFYTMKFHCMIDSAFDILEVSIIGDTITIHSDNHGSLTTADDRISENKYDEESINVVLCNALRDCIFQYFLHELFLKYEEKG